ncbi:phasin family protein [Neorhizobium galegae]|uniref:Phasin family protein n=1 Tax=Neorhizobium galegae TaxID=399 RepID=A0A6A1TKN0_NEOGA|nr:phasin family protein [Neorhizobium galegae]KAB1083930.1 phasin family protein [Neorhizobium galegae]
MVASQIPNIKALTNQINEMLAKLNLPGIDPAALVEEQSRNIEAVVRATQVANKGTYDVSDKQLELLRAATSQLLTMFADADLACKDRTELAKQAYEMALNGSREIASVAAKASHDAFAIAHHRMTENFERFCKAATPRKDT